MSNKENKHKQISIMSLIILIIVVLFSYLQFDDYTTDVNEYKELYKSIQLDNGNYIKTILSEESKLAEKSINIHVDRIQDQLELCYGKNLIGLDYDIDNPSSYSKLTNVFDNVLGDFYINKNSNTNKPFILSMNNLLWGRSLSYETEGEFLTIENLLSLQTNNELNEQAINSILDNNQDRYIFWQNDGKNELKTMSIDDLIDIYFRDGLKAMENYELLVPVYITQDGDIFGTKDNDGVGHKITNYKIIIVQRINIYDALSNYTYELSFLDAQSEIIKDHKTRDISRKTRTVLISVGITLIVLFGSAYLQNKKYK